MDDGEGQKTSADDDHFRAVQRPPAEEWAQCEVRSQKPGGAKKQQRNERDKDRDPGSDLLSGPLRHSAQQPVEIHVDMMPIHSLGSAPRAGRSATPPLSKGGRAAT